MDSLALSQYIEYVVDIQKLYAISSFKLDA